MTSRASLARAPGRRHVGFALELVTLRWSSVAERRRSLDASIAKAQVL